MEELTVPTLLLHIRSEMPNLTKAEQHVAEYILAHPNDVLRLSVFELAERCNTSDATVIRTFRKFGMSSFHEFKIALAQSIVSPLKMVSSDIDSDDSTEAIIRKVYNGVVNTIALTRDLGQEEKLVQAACMLHDARRIFILGLGGSSSVAYDLYHKMLRLGLSVIYQPDIFLQRIDTANFTQKGDVVFAISHSGSSRAVVEAAQLAKKLGASIISLSDISRSPLKDLADISLSVMSEENKFNLYAPSSKIAEYSIVDVLYSLISVLYPDESYASIYKVQSTMTSTKC